MSVPQNSKCYGVRWLLHPYMPCPGAWRSQSLLTVIHFSFFTARDFGPSASSLAIYI